MKKWINILFVLLLSVSCSKTDTGYDALEKSLIGILEKKDYGYIMKNLNESANLNLKKYAWQFGTSDFKSAINEVFNRAKVVDYQKIQCPCLFIMGEGEGAELQHQTRVIFEALRSKNSQTKLQIFEAESGADAHCQVNNLRLAHNVVFDWLDTLFEWN